MNKKQMTEQDIRTKFIAPAIITSGWDPQNQMREEVYFTDGRIHVKGKVVKRGKPKKADYVLYYKPNIPLAVVEAKDNKHSVGDGMQQALDYATCLDIPFVFSSNGDGFIFHDRTITKGEIEKELSLEEFPSPEDLWKRFKVWKGLEPKQEEVILEDYFYQPGGKTPRYYQQNAINRTIEAITKGKDRILLVMATGTGKTYTAFQIVWRLWKSKTKKRILYLADRNILIDQTMQNDFKHFGDKMTKVKNRNVDKSYEMYFALYQGLTGNEEEKNAYKQFSPDFFDLVIVDECHRGSASEESAWREVLDYFKGATQVGLTATPKETKDVSNIHYFGEPIYTYSLKQGIEDGFLAPYRVVKVALDVDDEWRPTKGQTDRKGNIVPDKVYNSKDYDRDIVIDERTKKVAQKVTEFLKNTNRYDKTIVFCVDIDHAERMRRALANFNPDIVAYNPKYVMRITGDNEIGKRELDNFINPEEKSPVIATTSKLMTTGVDAQTCKLIVLDSNIGSMTEFKQIIGRGTRIKADYDKYFFTIMDFRKVTNLFADPDFDGEPVQVLEITEEQVVSAPDIEEDIPNEEEARVVSSPDISINMEEDKPRKFYVDGVKVAVLRERIQYVGPDGKLITESLKDYTKKKVQEEFKTLDNFIQQWNQTHKKTAILEELHKKGILLFELEEEVGQDLDPFDLICHVAFDQKPLTRKERASKAKKKDYFTKYSEDAREVIFALLDKYADEGIEDLENIEVLKVKPLNKYGSMVEIVKKFGGKAKYLEAIQDIQSQLYA